MISLLKIYFFYPAETHGRDWVSSYSSILHVFLSHQYIPWSENCGICSCQHRLTSKQKGNEPAAYKKYNYFGIQFTAINKYKKEKIILLIF
jgi:hypothetical protein